MDLAEVVAGLRETGVEFEDVEVKRAAGGMPQSVAETMSAFANSGGGLIILGLVLFMTTLAINIAARAVVQRSNKALL